MPVTDMNRNMSTSRGVSPAASRAAATAWEPSSTAAPTNTSFDAPKPSSLA